MENGKVLLREQNEVGWWVEGGSRQKKREENP
jgi:hypothetical protein